MYMIAEVSQYVAVASFAEAWIEIYCEDEDLRTRNVASFAEAWIEIMIEMLEHNIKNVASFAEAWIEILRIQVARKGYIGRLLRGGVD